MLGIEADGKVNPAEQAFLRAQQMNQGTKESLARPDTDAWTLTLDCAVVLPMGSVVCSTRHTGNGFLVKDCDFGFNRSRGILIKGSNGAVAPSGAHRNIAIRNNAILNSSLPNIRVTSTAQLVVEGNRFGPPRPPQNREQKKPSAIVTEACDGPQVQAEVIGAP